MYLKKKEISERRKVQLGTFLVLNSPILTPLNQLLLIIMENLWGGGCQIFAYKVDHQKRNNSNLELILLLPKFFSLGMLQFFEIKSHFLSSVFENASRKRVRCEDGTRMA